MSAPSQSHPANDADAADSSAAESSLEDSLVADVSRPAMRPATAQTPVTERTPPGDSATGHYGPGYGEATRHQGNDEEVARADVDRPEEGDDPSCP